MVFVHTEHIHIAIRFYIMFKRLTIRQFVKLFDVRAVVAHND